MTKGKTITLTVVAAAGLCCVLAATAALGARLLRQRPAPPPVVLIDAPARGERAQVGQPVTVRASASSGGDARVTRVELWVDGRLEQVHRSPSPGGITSFRLSTAWHAATPGAHTLTVRAFDAQRARAHASTTVEILEAESGAPEGDGDGDEDGVLDEIDACPAEPGWHATGGCPIPGDADGDTVPDEEDVDPERPGLPEHGGCPDGDRDGIPDADDADPERPGAASSGGAPDADEDGLPDARDTCPWLAGAPESGGCPDGSAGDRDGDTVPDDADLAPDEPGLPINGGCPPPGKGVDGDGDGIPDDEEMAAYDPSPLALIALGPGRARMRELTLVELEVLTLGTDRAYDEVACYVGLGSEDVERFGTFQPLPENRWDVGEFLGGENGRLALVPDGDGLDVRMECVAQTFAPGPHGFERGTHHDLGSLARRHFSPEWYGNDIAASSEAGPDGHPFRVTYRLCVNSCEATVIPPPILTLYHYGGDAQLLWLWEGDRESIDGFRVYVNGIHACSQPPDRYVHSIRRYEPRCGRRNEFHVTAYRGDQESSPSNPAYWTNRSTDCPGATDLASTLVADSPRADVVLVTLGSDFRAPFVWPTVEEYIAVLERTEGLHAAYVELDSMECLERYGRMVSGHPSGGRARDVLREVVRGTGASYVLILGGIQHFPMILNDVPCVNPSDGCSLQQEIWSTTGDTVLVPSDAWYVDFDEDDVVDEGYAIGRMPGAYGDVAGVEVALRTATELHNLGGFTLDRPACFANAEGCHPTPPYGVCRECEETDTFFDMISSSDYITFRGHGSPYSFSSGGRAIRFTVSAMDSINLHLRHPVIIAYTPCEAGLLRDASTVSSEVTLATGFVGGGAAAYLARVTVLGTPPQVVEHFPADIEGGARIGDALFRLMRQAALEDETRKANAGQISLYGDPTLRRR
jgi:hypothetical protein